MINAMYKISILSFDVLSLGCVGLAGSARLDGSAGLGGSAGLPSMVMDFIVFTLMLSGLIDGAVGEYMSLVDCCVAISLVVFVLPSSVLSFAVVVKKWVI